MELKVWCWCKQLLGDCTAGFAPRVQPRSKESGGSNTLGPSVNPLGPIHLAPTFFDLFFW